MGSGKSTVAGFFAELGVPVYIADTEAKKLTNRSKVIRRKITTLLGENAYTDEGINRRYVADKIFGNPELLEKVNHIIHPKVARHFERWMSKQDAPYCIKEAAILFENGGYKNCDRTILITAPVAIRIERILKRDDTTRAAIEARMSNQWEDSKKLLLADHHIENMDLTTTRARVIALHEKLLAEL